MNGDAFVAELLEAMPTPQARLLLAARLAKYAGRVIYLPVESKKERRIRAAFNMLINGMSAADTAAALVKRFAVAARTAQRDVEAARKMSLKNVVSG